MKGFVEQVELACNYAKFGWPVTCNRPHPDDADLPPVKGKRKRNWRDAARTAEYLAGIPIIIDLLRECGEMRTSDLMRELKMTKSTLYVRIVDLLKDGKIKRRKVKKGTTREYFYSLVQGVTN